MACSEVDIKTENAILFEILQVIAALDDAISSLYRTSLSKVLDIAHCSQFVMTIKDRL